MSFFLNVLFIILLLIAAAYFAMAEISLAGSRKLRLTRLQEKGDKKAKLVLNIKENPGSFFSVVQIGVNAVAILGGIVGEEAFTVLYREILRGLVPDGMLASVAFTCSFTTVTMLFIIFADLIPKRMAMSQPEKYALKSVRSMMILITIFKPFVWFLSGVSSFFMKLMGVSSRQTEKITNEDVMATVEAAMAAGVIAPLEKTTITNVMDLESRMVPSAMTPRDTIISFDLEEPPESIRRKIRENPHDKFLVCDKTIDTVIGFVDSKELLKYYVDGQAFSLKDSGLVFPVLCVPDTLTLSETLDLFKEKKTDFAVVVNEYGLTVGIITLKDIVWVIMGDYAPLEENEQIVERDDGSWLIDGATPVEDVLKLLDLDSLPEDENYETIAGFMMYMLRRVPRLTDRVMLSGYKFEVVDVERARIDQVLVSRVKTAERAAPAAQSQEAQK